MAVPNRQRKSLMTSKNVKQLLCGAVRCSLIGTSMIKEGCIDAIVQTYRLGVRDAHHNRCHFGNKDEQQKNGIDDQQALAVVISTTTAHNAQYDAERSDYRDRNVRVGEDVVVIQSVQSKRGKVEVETGNQDYHPNQL